MDTNVLLNHPLPKGIDKQFVESLSVSKKVKKDIQKKFPVGQRSEPQFKVMTSLFEAGCDEKTVRYIHDHFPIGSKCRKKGEKWRDEEIKRARLKVVKPKSKKSELRVGGDLDVEDLVGHFENNVLGSTDFVKMKFPKPVMLIEPWLSEGSLNMIYGPTGIGKSTLAQIIAVLLTTWKKKEVDLPCIGPWNLNRRAPVFLLDGEMGEAGLQTRIKALRYPLGKASKNYPLGIYTVSHSAKKTGLQLNLTNEVWRESLYRYLKYKEPGYRIVILDNLVTLTPGTDENTKKDWDPVNQWLLRLKHLGITVILIHHSGRKKHQRGTTSREDTCDTIINLSEPDGYDISEGAYFVVKFEKTRNIPPGSNLKPFTLKLVPYRVRGLTWETGNPKAKPENEAIIAALLDGKLLQKEIADKVKLSETEITNIKKKAIERKLMVGKGRKAKPTEEGKKFLEDHKVELEEFYKPKEKK